MDSTVVFENTPKVPIDSFLDELSFEFTDAPYGLLEHYVKRTVQRMCERANVMRRTAVIHTQGNVHNYLLEPPDDTVVIAVMSIALAGHKFIPPKFARTNVAVWDCDCCACLGRPNMIHVEGHEILFSHPHSCDEWVVNMSVKPTLDACEVDEAFATDYAPIVIDGVRAALYAVNDKPWSSANKAQYYEASFASECATASVERMLGHQRGSFRAKRQRAF